MQFLNFTFFVQVCNFFITYWFLNMFMFRPVLIFLQKKQERDNRAQKAVQREENDLLELVEQKNNGLMSFKANMEAQYMVAPEKLCPIPSTISYGVDKKEAKRLIEEATTILVKKVPHVD